MDTTQLFLLIATAMGLVLLLDLISGWMRATYFSEPMLALLLGLFLGPAFGFRVIDLAAIGTPKVILEHAAQVTLAIGLMGVALRLPPTFSKRFPRTLAVLLLIGMPLMSLCAGALAWLTLGVPAAVALLLGAILTPTDPVISTSIVTGKVAEDYLPRRVRHVISGESGFNDGLAYPMVAFAVLFFGDPSAGNWAFRWFWEAWVLKTLLGTVLGMVLGYGAAKILHVAERHEAIEIQSLLSYSVALSLCALAVSKLAGGNGILTVFIAGSVFSTVARPGERSEEENVQEAVNRLFTLPIFLLLGLAAPWGKWLQLGWGALLFVGAVLLLRRLPGWLLLARITPGLRLREMTFAGWFGPIGIAALYYALHAEKETRLESLWPLTSLAICLSVFIHGATAAPFSRWLGRLDRAAH